MEGLHPSREGANPSRRTSSICGIRPSAGHHVANVDGPERHRHAAFCRRSIESDARPWYGREPGASPGGGSNFVPVAQEKERLFAKEKAAGAIPAGDTTFYCHVVQ